MERGRKWKEEKMITSDEPGYYREDGFGIRHENLMVCKKAEKTEYGQFMCFEFLTMVPFDLEVLTAKIQALLRRSYDFVGSSSIMEHKGAVLNLMDATLSWAGQQLELTKNELKILQALMEHKEKIVSREELMEKLWESDAYVDENTLSVNVNRLRKKLSAVGLDGFILTKKGIGYRIG